MWNAWTAPPGALPRDYEPWSCEAHCARCGELPQDCHCEDDEHMARFDRFFPTSARCCACGKFFQHGQPGSSWVFVPDSYLTREEDRVQCRRCTEKLGALTPNQSVRVDKCSGVIRAKNEHDSAGGIAPQPEDTHHDIDDRTR